MESVWLKQDAAARLHAMAKPRAPRERGITQRYVVGWGANMLSAVLAEVLSGGSSRQVSRRVVIRDNFAILQIASRRLAE